MGYSIRRARPSDYPLLPEIERAATTRFEGIDWLHHLDIDDVSDVTVIEAMARSGAVFVAADDADAPVGFLLAGFLDRALHIYELDVSPPHGRRGLGRQLIDAACAFAVTEGASAATLSTFRDVPWNGPFYAKAGFCDCRRRERGRSCCRLGRGGRPGARARGGRRGLRRR